MLIHIPTTLALTVVPGHVIANLDDVPALGETLCRPWVARRFNGEACSFPARLAYQRVSHATRSTAIWETGSGDGTQATEDVLGRPIANLAMRIAT